MDKTIVTDSSSGVSDRQENRPDSGTLAAMPLPAITSLTSSSGELIQDTDVRGPNREDRVEEIKSYVGSSDALSAQEDKLKTPSVQAPSPAETTMSSLLSGSVQETKETAASPHESKDDFLGQDTQVKKPFAETTSSSHAEPYPGTLTTSQLNTPQEHQIHSELADAVENDHALDLPVLAKTTTENVGPTSAPGSQTTALSQQPDTQDYPPDLREPFALLPNNPNPLNQPQPIRTRTSSPRLPFHQPSSTASSMSDLVQHQTGAKTVGNTPAQSPGLLSPTLTAKRPTTDSEEGHYTTPMLHPAHLQAPKETHKLWKDVDPISGRKLVNNYEIFHKLGSGQHGTVKLGRNLDTGESVAVKIVRRYAKKVRLGRSGDPNDMIKKEVAILKKARHPHVVSLFEVIDDEEFSKVYLVLEYVARGEIVWRKPTEKAIALFERERLERERVHGFDEGSFYVAVEQFNSGVASRREEKARIREEARLAQLQLEGPHSRRQQSIGDPFNNVDFGPESETESVSESLQRGRLETDTRMSRADIHAAETAKQSPQSATPIHTPRSYPHPVNLEQFPSSLPGSRPDSPSFLEGYTLAAQSDDGKMSDLDLHATLDQIIANQTQWSEDEENYRYAPCLTLNQTRDAFRDTVLGLEFLHYQGIMHRDIKPANLLWTQDYRVKISDFGVSYLGKPIREEERKDDASDTEGANIKEDVELAKTVGTPAFYAPELCDTDWIDGDDRSQRQPITGQIDVWALGVTLYGMIYGRLPFYDPNEFEMYNKIAREEVLIPHMRLKGVENNDHPPSNLHKRLDDVLEYEEVDDTLRDLIRRLLAKKPTERITLKEVKHHPWVIKGIDGMEAWLDQTDPARHTEGEKIKPSEEEIKDAVIGVLPMFDRFKTTVNNNLQRLGSVFRGRGSRKRTESNPKIPDLSGSASSSKAKEDRRSSLRGDEQIFSALRASRDGSEHPLSQSVAASPEYRHATHYFSDAATSSGTERQEASRGAPSDHAMSTADSVKTIRPHSSSHLRDVQSTSGPSTSSEDFSATTPYIEPQSSNASNVGHILAASGRFMNNMRSREQGLGRSSPSQSSRSSSVEAQSHQEELHAHPSLAVSSTVAAGRVDQPEVLREEVETQRSRSTASSTEAFHRAQEQNWRRHVAEFQRPGVHRRSISVHNAESACPPSPDDEIFYAQPRPASAADSSFGFPAISSSSDMIVSGDSAAHSRIPSVVSGASSLSAAPEDEALSASRGLGKGFDLADIGEQGVLARSAARFSVRGSASSQLPKHPGGDESGYNGEPEDSDSEDEGLAMA